MVRCLILLFCLLVVLGACSDDGLPGGDEDPNNHEVPDIRDSPGSAAHQFLSDAHFPHLIVELWFIEGQEPTSLALNAFESFLEDRLHKAGGIEVREAGVIDASDDGVQDTYSTSDIIALEERYRDEIPRSDTMTAFMIFLDGNSDRDDGNARILGMAYNSTSMAIFHETIEAVSGDGITAPRRHRVEETVINHEMGHILGLVDNGTPMESDHRDEDHGAHCDNEDCLMYYTMKQDDLISILLGGDDPALDANCLNDLEAYGGR